MAKKPAAATPVKSTIPAASSTTTKAPPPPAAPTTIPAPPSKSTSSSLSSRSSPQEIAVHVWNRYVDETPSRTKLLDIFMLFLVLVGAVQFLYCVLAGNYPFNAFLSGFSAAVGQFVLTASLRMQTTELPPSTAPAAVKRGPTKTIDGMTGEIIEGGTSNISSERAFADFVFGSLILHAFCINFIN